MKQELINELFEKIIKVKSDDAIQDALLYGTGIKRCGVRKWYNPLRYIMGRMYQKHVTLKDVFK